MARTKKTAAEIVETPVIDDAAVTAAVATLVEEEPVAESTEQEFSFDQLMGEIPDADADTFVRCLAESIDGREMFEEAKNPDNANIQRTLKKLRHQVVTRRAARTLLIANVDPGFVNRELHDGSRYNVYAVGKLGDLVSGLTGGTIGNAINKAIVASLIRCRDAGVTFTMEVAKMCCSRNYTGKDEASGKARSHLIRHTVAASTAPTQASSTMQALQTLGVVRAEGGKNPTYTLTDTPVSRKLQEMFAAA